MKKVLVEALVNSKVSESKAAAERQVDVIFDTIKETLLNGGKITIQNLCTLSIKKAKGRNYQNIHTKNISHLETRMTPRCRWSKGFAKEVEATIPVPQGEE